MNAEQIASSLPNSDSRKVFKDEAKSLIERELTALNAGLVEVLSRYQPNKAVRHLARNHPRDRRVHQY
ncbi:MAG: hypothetical protein WBP63_03825, partial [Silvibacterium sp.]